VVFIFLLHSNPIRKEPGKRSRYSDCLRAGRPKGRSSSPGGIKNFRPPSLISNGYRGLFSPEVKRPGREADLSLPTSAEIKKTWVYTFHSPIRLHGVVHN
jgi:hypothetical protein